MEVVELAPLLTEQQAKHSCQPGRPGVEAIQTQHRFMMAGLVRQLSQVSAYAADIMDSECVCVSGWVGVGVGVPLSRPLSRPLPKTSLGLSLLNS